MGGYPIWAYSPLLISLGGVWLFMRGVTEASTRLTATGSSETGYGLLGAGEEKLRSLDVHGSVWKARFGIALETVGILLFVAALLMTGAV